MMGKGFVFYGLIIYGLYYVYTHYDFAFFPPLKQTVKHAIVSNNEDYANYILDVKNDCERIKGGITDGVFNCHVLFNGIKTHRSTFERNVLLVKKKGKWRVHSYGEIKPISE